MNAAYRISVGFILSTLIGGGLNAAMPAASRMPWLLTPALGVLVLMVVFLAGMCFWLIGEFLGDAGIWLYKKIVERAP